MGGNAFNHLDKKSMRMDLQTYNNVLSDIKKFLMSLDIEYLEIKYIKDKVDFGDIDILINGDFNKLYQNLDKCLNLNGMIIKNGPVISVLYKDKYQIDFIKTEEHYKDYHCKYLSHNDLGNLIGRLVKPAKYRHTHNGLFYRYKNGTHYTKYILLSNNFETVLNILELDVDKFNSGFDSVEDMFSFITSTPYFNRDLFLFENLNNKNRVRDKKRKIYNLFLEWLENNHVNGECKTIPIPQIKFPFLVDEINKLDVESDIENLYRRKFNGDIVNLHTSLRGMELGNFIKLFKINYPKDYIITLQDYEVVELITKLYNEIT